MPAILIVMLTFVLVVVPATAAGSPAVTGITPATGINTTTVSITDLTGINFLPNATVMLTPVNVSPVHRGSITDGGGIAPFLDNATAVYISGTYAYIASAGSNALEIVDVSNPASPVHSGSIVNGSGGALLNEPQSVFVSGNYAYVASAGSNALEIIDVSNPASPVHSGSIVNGSGGALLNYPYSVFVSGDYAYVESYYSSALEIVDITNPANPVHSAYIIDGGGSVPCLSLPTSVYVAGNYAYVTSAGSTALEIVNVTDPTNPVHAGSLDNGNGTAPFLYDPRSVSVSGNYAYVASASDNTLEIVDVTDPANPAHTGSIQNGSGGALLNGSYSVFVSGNYAYVASRGSNALEIVDTGTITATSVHVVPSTNITCTFNLTGAVPGQYNVIVTDPDGSFGTLVGGFTVIGSTPTPTPTPTPSPSPTPTPTPSPSPTQTPSSYVSGESDSDPTPSPTLLRTTMITVNTGGYSCINRANVTGTGLSGLIITGTVASGPGQGIPPAPGIVYEYADLLPARYNTIEKATLSFSVPQSWLNEHHLTPQNIVIYYLTNSTWKALPTNLVKSEIGRSYYTALSPGMMRFAINGDANSSIGQLVHTPEPTPRMPGNMVQTTPAVTTVVHTPVALKTTESPAQPATQPSPGFSSLTIIGAGIVGIILLIGLAVIVRRRKTDL